MIRRKFARALRKWADLIDPRTSPSWQQNMVINISCDTSAFDGEVQRLSAQLAGLQQQAENVKGIM